MFSAIRSAADRGLSVIYVDHNMDHVVPLADGIDLMEHGRIVEIFDQVSINSSDRRLRVGQGRPERD